MVFPDYVYAIKNGVYWWSVDGDWDIPGTEMASEKNYFVKLGDAVNIVIKEQRIREKYLKNTPGEISNGKMIIFKYKLKDIARDMYD